MQSLVSVRAQFIGVVEHPVRAICHLLRICVLLLIYVIYVYTVIQVQAKLIGWICGCHLEIITMQVG